MAYIRFVDSTGTARWGAAVGEQTARPVVGDIYGEYKIAEREVEIVALLAPAEPPNILAIGRNYREHAKEMNADVDPGAPGEPLIFLKATSSVVGPEEAIILPPQAPTEVDFEAELAVIIGRPGKNISKSEAMRHVLGYTAANDVSARDCQKRRDKQWARGKSFDTFCPMGPVLIPAGVIDPDKLVIRSRLNGTIMQESNTAEMIFNVAELVSYLSHQFRLLSGTVILTGTPSGVGAGRTPPVYLQTGDEISVEIEGIGVMKNRVVSAEAP